MSQMKNAGCIDQMGRFANNNLVIDTTDQLTLKDDLFARYVSWGGNLPRNIFFRLLKQVVDRIGLLITLQRTDEHGVRRLYVKGVKLK